MTACQERPLKMQFRHGNEADRQERPPLPAVFAYDHGSHVFLGFKPSGVCVCV